MLRGFTFRSTRLAWNLLNFHHWQTSELVGFIFDQKLDTETFFRCELMLPRLALNTWTLGTHLSRPHKLWDSRQTRVPPCLTILPLHKQMPSADLKVKSTPSIHLRIGSHVWPPMSSVGGSLSQGWYPSASLSAALGNGGQPVFWGRERCLFDRVYCSNSRIISIKLPAVYPSTLKTSTLQPWDLLLRL